MMKRITVKVGDIFQVLTSEGVCYGQVINTHNKYKFVIAIFREFFSDPPEDFSTLTAKEPQFITTFLIQDAIRMGLFSLVGNCPVSDKLSEFPIFRGTNNLKGEETMWWFWDGEKEWKVDRALTEAERKYPEGPSLPSAPFLIKQIEANYRVEVDYIQAGGFTRICLVRLFSGSPCLTAKLTNFLLNSSLLGIYLVRARHLKNASYVSPG